MRTRIIKTSCIVAAITFFVSACMLDSMTWVPFILCLVSLAWIGIVAQVNYPYRKEEKDDENIRRNLTGDSEGKAS